MIVSFTKNTFELGLEFFKKSIFEIIQKIYIQSTS